MPESASAERPPPRPPACIPAASYGRQERRAPPGRADAEHAARGGRGQAWRRSSLKSPSAGRSSQGEDPVLARAMAQPLDAVPAGGVGVGGDVEATAPWREGQAGEVIGRGAATTGSAGITVSQRGHRLEAFAGGHDRDGRSRDQGRARCRCRADDQASGGDRRAAPCRCRPGRARCAAGR